MVISIKDELKNCVLFICNYKNELINIIIELILDSMWCNFKTKLADMDNY